MDKPELPVVGPEKEFRLVGTATSLAEANEIAKQYEMQGFEVKITLKKKRGVTVYLVWVAKQPEVLQGEAAEAGGELPPKETGSESPGDLPKI